MTAKNTKADDPPRGQLGPYGGPSKASEENSKKGTRSDEFEEDDLSISLQHTRMARSLFKNIGLDIENNREVLSEKDWQEKNFLHHFFASAKVHTLRTPDVEVPECALDFLDQVVVNAPELLEQEDAQGSVPLRNVAEFSFVIFFRIIEIVIPEALWDQIKIKCDRKKTCPLEEVNRRRREQCLYKRDRPTRNGREPEHPATTESMKDGPTGCHHNSVDITELEKRDKHLRSILRRVLQTRSKNPACLQSLIIELNFDPAQRTKIPEDSFAHFLQLHDPAVFKTELFEGYSPLQIAIQLFSKESIDHEHLFSIISIMVSHCPDSIFFGGEQRVKDRGKTAYRMLKEQQRRKNASGTELSVREKTEELLKRTCIGSNKSWNEKKEFLYWDAKSVKQFCLNLSGESTQIDREYIETIQKTSGMRFETVLESIKLPYWSPEDPQLLDHAYADGSKRQQRNDRTAAQDPYTLIFQWLREQDVEKIFKIEVDDFGPDPHTNAAIRECLRSDSNMAKTSTLPDFEVEVWEWKKFDICSKTILFAAPKVRELHLYSSGNTAVLHSWASQSGVSQLEYLEKLTISIYPNNSKDRKDCEDYLVELREELSKHCPRLKQKNIVVDFPGDNSSPGDGVATRSSNETKPNLESQNSTPDPKDWIGRLLPFKQFIEDILRSNMIEPDKKPSVKIAVLDDGVQLTGLKDLGEIKMKGETFRPDNASFFVGPCSHGTAMVRCIGEVFPMAELYVARLDDSREVENQKFTTMSACNALKWALEMDVDIISMSWTFIKKSEDERGYDENAFIDLVQNGLQGAKKPILFASLPDNGTIGNTPDYAPVGLPGVIKIGSATALGKDSQWNNFASRDFFTLPGEDLPSEESLTSGVENLVSGSSFSTAYAAGLAGLVLYCLKTHVELENRYENEEWPKRLNKAKTFDGMKAIFTALSGGEGEHFVRPYLILEGCQEDDETSRLRVMERIVTNLLPGSSLKS